MFFNVGTKDQEIVMRGCGNEQYARSERTNELVERECCKPSSTRMEAAGILALHAMWANLKPEGAGEVVPNGCDSQSAIRTYRKLQHITPLELIKLPNSILHR